MPTNKSMPEKNILMKYWWRRPYEYIMSVLHETEDKLDYTGEPCLLCQEMCANWRTTQAAKWTNRRTKHNDGSWYLYLWVIAQLLWGSGRRHYFDLIEFDWTWLECVHLIWFDLIWSDFMWLELIRFELISFNLIWAPFHKELRLIVIRHLPLSFNWYQSCD